MATDPIRILLQTTITTRADDWPIARFNRLGALLRERRDGAGLPARYVCNVAQWLAGRAV